MRNRDGLMAVGVWEWAIRNGEKARTRRGLRKQKLMLWVTFAKMRNILVNYEKIHQLCPQDTWCEVEGSRMKKIGRRRMRGQARPVSLWHRSVRAGQSKTDKVLRSVRLAICFGNDVIWGYWERWSALKPVTLSVHSIVAGVATGDHPPSLQFGQAAKSYYFKAWE